MNDATRSIEVYSPKFNTNIKGHAKIELRNPYRTQIIEHDNVVQNAVIEKYLRNLGYWYCDYYNGTRTSVWKRIFGGILLFDTAIPVGSEYMPAGVTMTANGAADTTNNTAPLAMGSWDAIKFELTDSSCTMTYNWSQEQACGDIASICLTSNVGGYIGYGNTDGAQKSPINIWNDQYVGYISLGNEGEGDRSYSIIGNSLVRITLDNSTKTITVILYPRPVNQCDVLANDTTLTFTYTTSLESFNPYTVWMPDGKGKFAIAGRKTVAVGDTIQVLILNLNNNTVSEYTITNNTNASWTNNTYDHSTGNIRGFDGEHVYFADTLSASSNLYKIKLSDSSVVATLPNINTTFNPNASDMFRPVISPFTKNHQVVISDGKYCIFDSINETIYPINMNTLLYTSSYNGTSYLGYHDNNDIIASLPARERFGGSINVIHNPMYLATINNLNEPVQKTNEDTMSVTYTLERSIS